MGVLAVGRERPPGLVVAGRVLVAVTIDAVATLKTEGVATPVTVAPVAGVGVVAAVGVGALHVALVPVVPANRLGDEAVTSAAPIVGRRARRDAVAGADAPAPRGPFRAEVEEVVAAPAPTVLAPAPVRLRVPHLAVRAAPANVVAVVGVTAAAGLFLAVPLGPDVGPGVRRAAVGVADAGARPVGQAVDAAVRPPLARHTAMPPRALVGAVEVGRPPIAAILGVIGAPDARGVAPFRVPLVEPDSLERPYWR